MTKLGISTAPGAMKAERRTTQPGTARKPLRFPKPGRTGESQISAGRRKIRAGGIGPSFAAAVPFMPDCRDHPQPLPRRRALVVFVNTVLALVGGGLSALLGAFALRPGGAVRAGRWIRAGTTADLKPDVPAPRVLSVPRVDGWYRARTRETVFLVWDGRDTVRGLSSTCTHLGCQVQWDDAGRTFKCPCHGSGYYKTGINFEGPAPRPLERAKIAIDTADGQILIDKSVAFHQERGEWTHPDSFLKL